LRGQLDIASTDFYAVWPVSTFHPFSAVSARLLFSGADVLQKMHPWRAEEKTVPYSKRHGLVRAGLAGLVAGNGL
jgi:hypothetical protein